MTTVDGWTVLDDETGVLTREYPFRKGALARMMTARLADGSLVAISPASGVPDSAFKRLEGMGGVSALIAPNGFHYYGLTEWTKAFPGATVHAPPAAAARIRTKLPGAPTFSSLEALAPRLAAGTAVVDLPDVTIGETWLEAKTRTGTVTYVSDSCFSMPVLPPFPIGLLFRFTGSAPGFRINGLGMTMFVKDREAYLDFMDARIAANTPTTVVTAHGAVVEGGDAGTRLRGLIAARR